MKAKMIPLLLWAAMAGLLAQPAPEETPSATPEVPATVMTPAETASPLATPEAETPESPAAGPAMETPQSTPEATPASTPEATPPPEATATATPSATPLPTATPESTPLATATPAAAPTATPLEKPAGPIMTQDAINVIRELTKIENTPAQVFGGLWLPPEYFQLSLKNNPNVTPKALEKLIANFSNYTVIGVLVALKTPDGGKIYSSSSKIFDSTTLVSPGGSILNPLAETEVDVSITRLLNLMTPKLREMAGVFGENMVFLVFPGKDDSGKRLADPLTEGKLEIRADGHPIIWRLPLGSMVPQKYCPVCRDHFPGAYHFCPYDGTTLH